MVHRPTLAELEDSQARVVAAIGARLEAAGHQAWLVGGCVRDLALGRGALDVDIATDAVPERIESLFEHTIGVGRAFGTVVVADFGPPIEVTTFRADGTYTDGRRPSAVAFSTSLEEDARRRDFTCNALYLGATSGTFADPTGGLADLAARRLATVGDPHARLAEDSLRLLRLVRFAATHDLEPTAETLAAARLAAPLLARVARERVLAELTGLGDRGDLGRGFALLTDLALVEPALGSDVHLVREQLAVAARLPRGVGAAPALALLLAAGGFTEATRQRAAAVLERLHSSREFARTVLGLLEALAASARPDAPLAELVRLRERAPAAAWLALARASVDSGLAGAPDARAAARLADVLEAWPSERALPPSHLSPNDLVELGVPRGPRLGVLLRELVDAAIEERILDRAQALEYVRRRSGAD
jgi:tRNA nucleotidyltransferase/poly(A) polymerase